MRYKDAFLDDMTRPRLRSCSDGGVIYFFFLYPEILHLHAFGVGYTSCIFSSLMSCMVSSTQIPTNTTLYEPLCLFSFADTPLLLSFRFTTLLLSRYNGKVMMTLCLFLLFVLRLVCDFSLTFSHVFSIF